MGRKYCEMGYLPKYCAAWMEGLATTLPDPARVLEIGTGTGCSLLAMLQGLRLHDDVHAWTVDILRMPDLANEMKQHGVDKSRYTQIHGDSVEVAQMWNVPLNIVYIDGTHTEAGCVADIEAWGQHLVFGGLMIFDDYEQDMFGVTEAVDAAMFAEDSSWRFIGQVGRLIAFEKGTLTARAPWLTDYMVKYNHNVKNKDGKSDPWLWWGWGFPGKRSNRRYYGKSPKGHYVDKLP